MGKKSLLDLYLEHTGKVSDKWMFYLFEYDRLFLEFRDRPVRMLEIGIQNGGSLDIWSKFFPAAEVFVGCDIDPACATLQYENPKIHVVVGDANSDATRDRVIAISPHFDIIIDDGSHHSRDIVKSFLKYFSKVSENGIFVFEDLHCSYWETFEGGLFHPFSSIEFFKRLADIVNAEHWGHARKPSQFLAGFAAHYGLDVNDEIFSSVHSIEFSNSICVVRKRSPVHNTLGTRFIAGTEAQVVGEIASKHGAPAISRDESCNFWAVRDVAPAEELQAHLRELVNRAEKISQLTAELVEAKSSLSNQHLLLLNAEECITSQKAQLVDAKASSASQRRALDNARASVEKQQTELNEAKEKITVQQNELAHVKAQQRGLGDEAARLHATIEELRESTSWKISAPVRWLGTGLRKLRERAVVQPPLAATGPELDSRVQLDVYNRWILAHESEDIVGVPSEFRPLISVLMPTFNPKIGWLREAIDSVVMQNYSNWELCIADDASMDPQVWAVLLEYKSQDERIKIIRRPKNGHISAASNSALELVNGEWVTLLDHDDLLAKNALSHLVQAIHDHPDASLIYSDEDKVDEVGVRKLPFFKPDWSPHLALSQAYLGHLVCIPTTLVRDEGGFRTGFDGAQDYDLWLRIAARGGKVVHIPRILYHWRMHVDSTAGTGGSKPYAHEAGRLAVQEYLARKYPGAGLKARDGANLFTYSIEFHIDPAVKVSIIIPTRDKMELLEPCMDGILNRSSWKNFEVIIVDNGSVEPRTAAYLATVVNDARVSVVRADIEFNWSKLNNIGVAQSTGSVLLFLNNDTDVIVPDWMQVLAGYALLPDVGSVGALLLFEDRSIQHSGVVVGMGGWADHVFRTQGAQHSGEGPFVSPVLTRNVLAVTGACTAIERSKFISLGGYDETFVICGSDVELGLRAWKAGYYNVVATDAKLVHYESKTRTPHVPEGDFQQSMIKYAPYRTEQTDPFYNPNLSMSGTWPALKQKDSHA